MAKKAAVVAVSASTLKAVTTFATASNSLANATQYAVDGLMADGIKPEFLTSPKEKKGKQFDLYTALRSAVVLGFSEAVRKMLAQGAKGLAELGEDKAKADRQVSCKENCAYWQKQIGSKLKDLRKALQRRIDGAKAGGKRKVRTLKDRATDTLEALLKQIQEAEKATFAVDDVIKDIKAAIAHLKRPLSKA